MGTQQENAGIAKHRLKNAMSAEYISAAIIIAEKYQYNNEAPLGKPTDKGLSAWKRRDLEQALKRWSLE